VNAIVPNLSEPLNNKPGSKYPLDDTKITTRCPRSDCFSFQQLSDASITQGRLETRYGCRACGSALVVIRRSDAMGPHLPQSHAAGGWTYWVGGSGINIRLANTRRLKSGDAAESAG
jgi:hypothetical protein